MTQDNIGYAVVSRVCKRIVKRLTEAEVLAIPEDERLRICEEARSPICAPSRSGLFHARGDFFRESYQPTSGTHVGLLHYFEDCARYVANLSSFQSKLPITAEMAGFLKLAPCKKCAERLKREMPAIELKVGAHLQTLTDKEIEENRVQATAFLEQFAS